MRNNTQPGQLGQLGQPGQPGQLGQLGQPGPAGIELIDTLEAPNLVGPALEKASGMSENKMRETVGNLKPSDLVEIDKFIKANHEKVHTLLINIQKYLVTDPDRGAYGLDKIFANAQLDDASRVEYASQDLLEAEFTNGFENGKMSQAQQNKMLEVHHMFSEKGVFELNYSEKRAKITALLEDGTFTKQQAKLLLDRGYCAGFGPFLAKFLQFFAGGRIKYGMVVLLLVIIFIFMRGCGPANYVRDTGGKVVEATEEVVGGVKRVIKPVTNGIEGTAAVFNQKMGTDSLHMITLTETLKLRESQLEKAKIELVDIQQNKSFFEKAFNDPEQEDYLEEELIPELEKIIRGLESDISNLEVTIEDNKNKAAYIQEPLNDFKEWVEEKTDFSSGDSDTTNTAGQNLSDPDEVNNTIKNNNGTNTRNTD